DRGLRRDRQSEGAALEWKKLGAGVAMPLRHEPDGDFFGAHRLGRLLEGIPGLPRVAAVEDEVPRKPVEPAEHRDASDLALARGNGSTRKDRPERHDVQEALVIGDDHTR